MPHTIAESEIEPLSRLAGVLDFDEWKRQLDGQQKRISEQLDGGIEVAWTSCLPTWLSAGRVNDLARSIRVPRYWPSYARNLGVAFTERFWDDASFVVRKMMGLPVDSHEFLCAFDLLEFFSTDAESSETELLDELFGIDCPVPRVVQLEIGSDPRYAGVSTVGQVLRRSREIQRGDVA